MSEEHIKKYDYFNDCPIVPTHLSHKISQEAWDWINQISETFYFKQRAYPNRYQFEIWQIRGYWLITYFCNPSQKNLNVMLNHFKDFEMIDSNLEYLTFRYELSTMLRSVKKEIPS